MHVQNFTIIWEHSEIQLAVLMKYVVQALFTINCNSSYSKEGTLNRNLNFLLKGS